MSKHTKLTGKDLSMKSQLTQYKKIGGRIVEQPVHLDNSDDDSFLDELLNGQEAISPLEIEEGRENLITENPAMASASIHDLMNSASDMNFDDFNNPKRMASSKRVGKLADDQGETLSFKRSQGSIELTTDEGEVIEVLSSREFDYLLDTGEYRVL
jgi:hypothetical protein